MNFNFTFYIIVFGFQVHSYISFGMFTNLSRLFNILYTHLTTPTYVRTVRKYN